MLVGLACARWIGRCRAAHAVHRGKPFEACWTSSPGPARCCARRPESRSRSALDGRATRPHEAAAGTIRGDLASRSPRSVPTHRCRGDGGCRARAVVHGRCSGLRPRDRSLSVPANSRRGPRRRRRQTDGSAPSPPDDTPSATAGRGWLSVGGSSRMARARVSTSPPRGRRWRGRPDGPPRSPWSLARCRRARSGRGNQASAHEDRDERADPG